VTPVQLAPAFFLACVVIIAACKVVGWAVQRIGQPPVVGEMLAGVVLGPSVLGALLPPLEDALFPQPLRPVLYVVGQIGLVAFMFRAGWEFRADRFREVARSAALVSTAGMVAPILLGVALVLVVGGPLGGFGGLLAEDVPLGVTAAFVGVTLAVTAFPMMARIIDERRLSATRFGSLSLACGAIDDAAAWILLAGVFSVAATSAGLVSIAVGGSLLLVLALVLMARSHDRLVALAERLNPEALLLVVIGVLFLAAWYTDVIGLYAVFGAFTLGMVFPRSEELDRVVERINPVGALFVPLFFTYSGLNTNFLLLGSGPVLVFTVVMVLLAIAGKFGGCWAAARLAGEPNWLALRVGALMNARGLMQLIAINLGLTAGIVTPALFSALVVVALVTTTMATPLLAWFDRRDRRRLGDDAPAEATPAATG
jgi:K+:H+ antiporter